MSLFDSPGVIGAGQLTRPMAELGGADPLALATEEYGQVVEHTIRRRSALESFIQMRPVVGTTTLTDFAIGETTLGKVTPGETPEAQPAEFSKASISVDTVVYARNALPLLEVFQSHYDARREIGIEHGKEMAKFRDQSLFIQAAKAADMTDSRFSDGSSDLPGFKGGSKVTLNASSDIDDPALLYSAIGDLFTQMEEKDVEPNQDDVIVALRPKEFYTLMDAEQIVNGDYVTADGNELKDIFMFKAWGCPVIKSNNIPSTNISGHLLSNSNNSNAYDGDFTKLGALAFSPRALLGGETIPLTSDVYYEKLEKSWFVDSHMAYAVTPNRAEFAGSIWLP